MFVSNDKEKEDVRLDPCTEMNTDLRRWVADICEESRCHAEVNGDRDNMHYLPELVPHLISLGGYPPLWTRVMVPLFQSKLTAASSNVEQSSRTLNIACSSMKISLLG